jgi:hypothetical protein
MLAVIATSDLLIGFIYLVGLPKTLQISHLDLLRDNTIGNNAG